MAISLTKIEKAYDELKNYSGENPFIINLKNTIIVHQLRSMNDFEVEYVLSNFERKPMRVDKLVMVADWWGEKKKIDWETDFTPEKIKITWFLGETEQLYHFFCIYRRSQEKAVEVFAPKKAIITDFLSEDYHNFNVDLTKYNTDKRTVMPHQVEAVKFMLSRKKCIIADEMGSGKTFSAILAALEGHFKHVLVICPSSVWLISAY